MPAENPIQLVVDEASQVLSAIYQPDGDNPVPPTRQALAAAVQAQGWGLEVLDEELVASFLNACHDADGAVRLAIGAIIVHGSFELDVTPDLMSALLTLKPPRGGNPVTEDDVRNALKASGIIAGILDLTLRDLIAQGECENVVIAEGKYPVPGRQGHFESLLESLTVRQREDDEDAIIDYREMGNLTLVVPGEPLMRRIPSTPGEPGHNVLGRPIEPPPLPDVPFAPNLTGVETDPDDPDLLLAAIAGVPMVVAQGVQVNSLVEVDAVDLTSGNIEFDGTLRVKGDITMGMLVRVTGDVVVNGTIEAAHVHAGGNITVNGGIVGMADAFARDNRGNSRQAHISCGGTVKARFLSNAEVSAGKNVAVEREVRQCTISAGESVLVGPPGSQQGTVTGGQVQALKSVQSGTLGSMAASPTEVRVGLDPHATAKRAALADERRDLDDKKDKLEKLVLFLKANPHKNVNGVGDRAANTLHQVLAGLTDLQAREEQLNRDLLPLQTATITAKKRFYGGVKLYIANRRMEFIEDQIGGRAGLENGEIVIR
ncbi:DUF342 domain-containing protein [Bordetella genomosp. 13]|uniref:DUF342 domain-containing protein n=1 Tax=Bordetella genomosp. 13 TaxID=463040 RepID=UPI0011A9C023|nr:FapA family protein [Bordetella genomosp. 13]